jgi:hypothetical protein
METLVKLLGEQWVIGALQLLLGGLVKPQLKDKLLATGQKATGLIPLLNLVIAYLGFQLMPASAQAAAFIGTLVPIREGASVLALALLQTVMITGTHSTLKNTVVPVAKVGLGWLFGRLMPWIQSR